MASQKAREQFTDWLQTTKALMANDEKPVVSQMEKELLDSTIRGQQQLLDAAKSKAELSKAAFEKEARILMARASNMNQILKSIKQ
uniref:Uncharacterized protein n=1 Tax=Clandestinovirus TaxID=2831644 RepID=A0A8F8KTP7_9VIRU|nr:hypothetical protein KOM_12_587 [Clandestinovirus]